MGKPKPPTPSAATLEAAAAKKKKPPSPSNAIPAPVRKQVIVRNGNAQSKAPPAAPPSADDRPPLFPPNCKTPVSLLSERAQKAGWERPAITTKELSSGVWTASVRLYRFDAKKERESVSMRPPPSPSPICVEKQTAIEAKHYAALYALYRFSNNLQLKLQLPPQTRDYWAALETEKSNSPPNKAWLWSLTPFETALAAPPPPATSAPFSLAGSSANSPFSSTPTSRAATPSNHSAHSSARWDAAPEVKMPTALRDMVEETIRSSMMLQNPVTANLEQGDEDYVEPTAEDTAIVQHLVQVGFRAGHIKSALNYIHAQNSSSLDPNSLLVAVQSYLHLHTNESDLPAALRASRPPDATARLINGSESLSWRWRAEALSTESGYPLAAVERALTDSEGEVEGAVDLLLRRLMRWEEASWSEERFRLDRGTVVEGQAVEGELAELEERRRDELLGLEGIWGTRYRTTERGIEILLSSTAKWNQRASADQVILRVFFHPKSSYPSPSDPEDASSTPHLPTFYVYSSTLPTYLRLHLTSMVSGEFSNPQSLARDLIHSGFGVINEMATFLSENWEKAIDQPVDSRALMSKLMGTISMQPAVASRSGARKIATKARTKYVRPATLQMQNAMRQTLETNSTRPGYEKMLSIRQKLPAWSMREEIVDLIKNNRVVIVSGETGSGKTTQVPSFVLDDAIASNLGASTNIIVTQPRRVSAIGVATRVGAERLEDINDPSSRQLVGYAIRGERKAGPDCRLLFCTTGVVLARMNRGGDPNLEDVSHIFIDEVHERSVDSDFLLLELREILARNKKIKVILMSATINQAQFSSYFGGAPCTEIAGFAHPVRDHYLEDILPLIPSFQPSSRPAKKATQHELDAMRKGFEDQGISNERTLAALECLTRAERIDYGLLGAVVAHCIAVTSNDGGGGDILVFMTGVAEINQSIAAIKAAVSSSEKLEVFPLHANLTSQEQASVFRPTKAGYRKIVVSTNVAETSITIDGITSVVDCGRVKENTFDPDTTIVKLEEQWTSRASAKQRRGRAGRTRPGDCFKLFSRYNETNHMAPHPTPEMVRIPLEALCLQIKSMREDADVKDFLSKALSPPDVRAVDAAWATLELLNAVESGGCAARLTPLGRHLAMIPVDLRLGKMLVLAATFSCLEPILTVAAILSSKPLFLSPMDRRDEAKKARSMFYSSRSDLISDVKAFQACLTARENGNSSLRIFAEDNFISLSSFRDVLSLQREYLTALSDVGFVPPRALPSLPKLNQNSSSENLLKAIIYAGTGRIVKVKLPPAVFDKGLSGAIERERVSKEVKFYEPDGRVFLHPGSLLFSENRFATPFMTYFSKHVTTKPFLRDATEIPIYGILLFGPKIDVDLERGLIVRSTDILIRAWPRIGILTSELRRLFDEELLRRIEQPDVHFSGGAVVESMLKLLEKDGALY